MNDNLAPPVDAYSVSSALRLRYRILAHKASARPRQAVLPPPVGEPRAEHYDDDKTARRAAADEHPLAKLMRLRAEAAAKVEKLLSFLDDTDGIVDDEECDEDGDLAGAIGGDLEHDDSNDEPSLGFVNAQVAEGERISPEPSWLPASLDQTLPQGGADDAELDGCDFEDGHDAEPSLCGIHASAQPFMNSVEDGELDAGDEAEEDYDREPSLGWPDGRVAQHATGDSADLELC